MSEFKVGKTNKRKFVLLKDIVIPRGTVLLRAPFKRCMNDEHFEVTIGLSNNTSGEFTYCIDENHLDELSDCFVELKE